MMSDIQRICQAPANEDRYWFPDIAGQDWLKVLDFAMRNFKDESHRPIPVTQVDAGSQTVRSAG